MKVKGYFGAPRASDLTWNETSLYTSLLPAFLVFRDITEGRLSTLKIAQECSDATPATKWRSIPLSTTTNLRPDFLQPTASESTQHSFNDPALNRGNVSFLTNETTTQSTEADRSDISEYDRDYLKHCLKRDDRTRLRHLTQLDGTRLDDSQDQDRTSFKSNVADYTLAAATFETTALRSFDHTQPEKLSALTLPASFQFTSLKDLPSARHLLSIQPSTVTVNLVVAVLSSTLRQVVIKRKPRAATTNAAVLHPPNPNRFVVDLLVSDTTRQGFKCTFWLPPSSSPDLLERHQPLDIPLSELSNLRPGTIVLLHKMMLTVYSGAVYAQSLNPREARQRSKVDVLAGVDGMDRFDIGEGELRGRIDGLREWVERYIIVETGRKRKRGDRKLETSGRRDEEMLPEDSMVA